MLIYIKRTLFKHLIYLWFTALFVVNPFISFSQVDTEFWFVVPELSHRGNTGGTPGTLRIATMELPATVIISMPANPYHAILNPTGFQDIIVDIAGNSTAAVDLSHLIDVVSNPTNNRLENKPLTPSGINDFGLHITATNMITAYWEVNYDFGADLWTLKGTNALGTLFYTPFQTFYNNRSITPRTYSAIDIVATQDNTQITITLPPGKAASYGSMLTGIPAGGTHVVTLNRGQTFSLFPFNYSILGSDRLAGTRIESTQPIAVTLKDDAIASGSKGQDVVGDQIVPVDIIGDNYIVPEINNPNHVYVLATENNTNIYVYDAFGLPIGPSPYTTLNAGEQALVIVPGGSKYARITSRQNPFDPVKPFYTFQMGIENQSRGGALVPAIGCTGNTQLAFTRARSDNKFYFFIITEKGNEDKFLIDGFRDDGIIDPGAFTDMAGSDGWVVLFTNSINSNILTIGQHLVQNTGGIFHLAILNGFPGAAQGRLYYGYYSDFGGLNIGANVAGTNSSVVRACYGDPVQLYAYGGTNYSWSPDTYLDDATSNLPTAINLPPGPHNYTVTVSGACGQGDIDLTVLVSTPVIAFFEPSVNSGCSPLDIQFDDQSSGGFSWQYDLGDGTPLIRYDLDPLTPYPPPPNYPNPFSINHIYTNTTDSIQQHEVTLLVKNESGCSDIYTKTIVVFPEIHSDFSVDVDEGCEPLLVQFQNNSYGDTAYWVWEFGDGGSSVEKDPQHVFRNLFGPDSLVFETRLIAVSPNYCRDTSTHTITVMPYIEANFAFDTVAACSPHEIIITDQSFGADFYSWDFGDGTTSTSPGPQISKVYVNNTTNPITYTIRLRVDNEEGCFHEIAREVTVYPEIVAAFDAFPDEGCSPFEVTFQNNSTGAAFYFWDFGDGGTSTEAHPIHQYERNLMDHDTVYTVTMVATSDEFCRDTAFIDILVHPYIEAAFTVEDIVGCHPFIITIDNMSIGVDQYYWNFGDGSPISDTTAATFEHTYLNNGNSTVVYPLQLIVQNNQGCTDTLTRYITVHPEITANFTTDAVDGCHPLTVSFTDLSLNAVVYYWDFGDGASSILPSPVHTFNNFGTTDTTYVVTLTTSTADGECVKSISWPIVIHPYVYAEFTVSKALDCNPFEVTFENLSVGGLNYIWDFGDGTVISTLDPGPITHIFVNNDFNNQQDFEVVLLVENFAGCTSEARKTVSVYPDIEASFTASDTVGCHPLEVEFTNLSNGAQIYLWDFGDGSSSNLQNPIHTFTNTGTVDSIYTVSLLTIAPNHLCRDSLSIDITVHPYINAEFTFQENIQCSPSMVQFTNASVGGEIFHWDFGDGSDSTTTDMNPMVHVFNNSSFIDQESFMVTLTAENAAGCTSQITKIVEVYPDIQADFSMSVNEGCHPLEVDFTNLSNGGYTYLWDFGDGSSSAAESPFHTFTNFTDVPITRQVRLISTSRFNCTSEIMYEITIHPNPMSRFETDKIIDCAPFDVSIINTSINAEQYTWIFGDGNEFNTNSTDPINHVYDNLTDNIAIYELTLIASTSYGCADTSQQKIYVYPRAIADFSSNNEGCSPVTVNFTNESVRGDSYLWDFGDGSSMKIKDPTNIYFNFSDDDETYYITLTTTTEYGCVDSKTDSIYVYPQPDAEFIASPTHQVFPSSTVDFTNLTNLGPWTYQWEMGDGFSTSLEDPQPHTYATWGEYDVTLSVSSAHCADTVSHLIRIFAAPPIAGFDEVIPDCAPLTVQFRNTSLYGDSYLWEFDDGTSSTEFEPEHTFTEYGFYNVKLTVTGQGGIDYAYHQVEVYRNPTVDFRLAPELVMLPDQVIKLFNMSEHGDHYLWDFGDGGTSTEENPVYLYSEVGTYTISLDVWTEHGCTDRLVKPDVVTVIGKGLIRFPNAFKPSWSGPSGGYYNLNETERNIIFHPLWEGVEIYHLEIYDRWGELLYTSDDVMKGWDGYYKERLCKQDVYVWKCQGTFVTGKNFLMAGDVTLLHHHK